MTNINTCSSCRRYESPAVSAPTSGGQARCSLAYLPRLADELLYKAKEQGLNSVVNA